MIIQKKRLTAAIIAEGTRGEKQQKEKQEEVLQGMKMYEVKEGIV